MPSLDDIGVAVPVVAQTQLLCLRFEGKAIERQRLGPSPGWVRHVLPALAYAQLRAEEYASISIRVAAVYPEPPAGGMPDFSGSDYDPAFDTHLRSALHGSPWQALIGVIEVQEQWRPVDTPRIDFAIYGRAKAMSVACESTAPTSDGRDSDSPNVPACTPGSAPPPE